MADSDVTQRGTDTSGRPLYASRFMWRWWDAVCDELGFEPTVVQGAHMARAGGGAAASAGYHDGGGCFDLRVWDRTDAEVAAIIRVTRALGAGSWVRDSRHGMDPHIHFVLGADHDLASGARFQWSEYLGGRDGLASRGADYHPRPNPLVTDPRPLMEDIMASKEELAELLDRKIGPVERQSKKNGRLTYNRDQKIMEAVAAVAEAVGDTATKAQVRKLAKEVAALSDDQEGA